jgi:hypothetical protein
MFMELRLPIDQQQEQMSRRTMHSLTIVTELIFKSSWHYCPLHNRFFITCADTVSLGGIHSLSNVTTTRSSWV